MEGHIQCAADEMPIKPEEDEVYFGPALKSLCHTLAQDKEGWYVDPSPLINMRSSALLS
jgi:DEAD/DEAH box helicase domain-containing protein